MSAEDCARVILAGVQRNQAIIVVTNWAKIMYLLQRLSPGLVRYLFRVHMRRQYRPLRVEGRPPASGSKKIDEQEIP